MDNTPPTLSDLSVTESENHPCLEYSFLANSGSHNNYGGVLFDSI